MTPKGLREEIARRLAKRPRLVLLLDFDGTLAPIVRRPHRARIGRGTRETLQRLARHPRVRIAVLSGRPRRDLVRLVAIPGVALVGDHGFDAPRSGAPRGKGWSSLRRALRPRLQEICERFSGSEVEWKPVTVTVHFRRVTAPRLPAFHRALRAALLDGKRRMRTRSGKKCLEILPPVRWGKDDAARAIAASARSKATVFVAGDDRTDEEMFRALPRAITVRVGGGPTRAQYRLRDPRALAGLLRWVEKQAFSGALR